MRVPGAELSKDTSKWSTTKLKTLFVHAKIANMRVQGKEISKTHIKTCIGKRQGSSGECAIEDSLLKMNINHQMRTSRNLKNEEGTGLNGIVLSGIWVENSTTPSLSNTTVYFITNSISKETLKPYKKKHHDNLKNQFCDENNYLLLRIPYWDFANTHQIVVEFIQTHTIWNNDE
jgi:hypothetical protein